MQLMFRWMFVLVGTMGLAASPLAAQAALRGIVVEEGTNRPLSGVTVMLDRTFQQTITDQSGRFFLADLPLGARAVLFRSIGHIALRIQVTLAQGDTATANVALMSDPFRLDSVTVTAPSNARVNPRLQEFEERRRMGIGFFLDSAYLRRADGRRMSEVLREAPSIRVLPSLEGGSIIRYHAASVRRAGMRGEVCFLSIYLDGVPMYRSGGVGGRGFGEPVDLSRDINISSLDAVEVYASASEVPVEFAGQSADCGVILLWTRRGQ
ncbi:MAG: carboxypeptidase-like regulatory domain-containing protein [Gemmatimonadales bacterium]